MSAAVSGVCRRGCGCAPLSVSAEYATLLLIRRFGVHRRVRLYVGGSGNYRCSVRARSARLLPAMQAIWCPPPCDVYPTSAAASQYPCEWPCDPVLSDHASTSGCLPPPCPLDRPLLSDELLWCPEPCLDQANGLFAPECPPPPCPPTGAAPNAPTFVDPQGCPKPWPCRNVARHTAVCPKPWSCSDHSVKAEWCDRPWPDRIVPAMRATAGYGVSILAAILFKMAP